MVEACRTVPEQVTYSDIVLAEGPDGEMCSIRCKVSVHNVPWGPAGGVIVYYPPNTTTWVYKGASGAPVYDENGDLVAVVRGALGRNKRAPAFHALPASELREAWRVGRESVKHFNGRRESVDVPGEVGPGDSVVILDMWGDHVRPISGVLTAREGEEVLALGHEIDGVGNCRYALARAPVLGFVKGADDDVKITGVGAIIGTITHDSGRGVFGILGVQPEWVDVKCRIYGPECLEVDRTVHVVRDDRAGVLEERIAAAIWPSLHAADISYHVQSVDVGIALDERVIGEYGVSSKRREDLEGRIIEVILAEVSGSLRETEAVSINLDVQ
jgi:hypothetical protein